MNAMMLTKDRLLNEKEREAIFSLISDGMSKTDVRWLNNILTNNESNLSGCKPSKATTQKVKAILYPCICKTSNNGCIEKLDFNCPFHCYSGSGKGVHHAPLKTQVDVSGVRPTIQKRFYFLGGRVHSKTRT